MWVRSSNDTKLVSPEMIIISQMGPRNRTYDYKGQRMGHVLTIIIQVVHTCFFLIIYIDI